MDKDQIRKLEEEFGTGPVSAGLFILAIGVLERIAVAVESIDDKTKDKA